MATQKVKAYLARASFYDTECHMTIAIGFNKKRLIKRAVKLLKAQHKITPFPSYFFGERPNKITSHFVKITEHSFVE